MAEARSSLLAAAPTRLEVDEELNAYPDAMMRLLRGVEEISLKDSDFCVHESMRALSRPEADGRWLFPGLVRINVSARYACDWTWFLRLAKARGVAVNGS